MIYTNTFVYYLFLCSHISFSLIHFVFYCLLLYVNGAAKCLCVAVKIVVIFFFNLTGKMQQGYVAKFLYML